jgi:hypothetical protein
MDIEDVEDKFRRNLVAVSAVVLLCAFLGTSMSDLAGRLMGASGAAIPDWKLLAAAVAVMVYLGLRYWHSGIRSSAAKLLLDEVRQLRVGHVMAKVQKNLDAYTASGVHPRIFTNPAELVNAIELEGANMAKLRGDHSALPRPQLAFAWGVVEESVFNAAALGRDEQSVNAAAEEAARTATEFAAFSGEGTLALEWHHVGRASTQLRHVAGKPISYSIPRWPSFFISARAWLRAIFNSRGGLEFAWVVALAVSATLWLAWRLWCLS